MKIIDVWDARTFDEGVGATLRNASNLVRNYLTAEDEIFLSYDLGRGSERPILRPPNPYTSAFLALKAEVAEQMQSRTIRAWHYTRLTESEVDNLREQGVQLSTPWTLRLRLDASVASGKLDAGQADALYTASPFHSEQLNLRSNKFFLTSHPQPVADPGVQRLLAYWGGEVASFWTRDPALLAPISAIGAPRVIEAAVPLIVTQNSHNAAGAVIATFGRTLGCIPSAHMFDLWVTAPLASSAILRIHTQGDPLFESIGHGYPEGYVNVDIGHWKELTGED